jgi:hypothetical protein
VIDWTNPAAQIAPHFTAKDALWLPRYGRLAYEGDGLTAEIKDNLLQLFTGPISAVRSIYQRPFYVNVAYRNLVYNALVGGAKNSAHLEGKAVDFTLGDSASNKTFADWLQGTKQLETQGLRMEDNSASNWAWIHLDSRAPGPSGRVFIPSNI